MAAITTRKLKGSNWAPPSDQVQPPQQVLSSVQEKRRLSTYTNQTHCRFCFHAVSASKLSQWSSINSEVLPLLDEVCYAAGALYSPIMHAVRASYIPVKIANVQVHTMINSATEARCFGFCVPQASATECDASAPHGLRPLSHCSLEGAFSPKGRDYCGAHGHPRFSRTCEIVR